MFLTAVRLSERIASGIVLKQFLLLSEQTAVFCTAKFEDSTF